MKFAKKLLTSALILRLLSHLISGYIRLVAATCRWQTLGKEVALPLLDADKPVIFAFWHGRLLLMPALSPKQRRMNVVISQHRDGELIARAMANFDFGWVQGSTRKGAVQALRAAIQCLERGENLAITPDGPKGPRMRLNSNIIALARITGCPVIPITYSVDNARFMQSWDRFMIPRPFGKGVFIYGRPVVVTEKLNSQEGMKKAGETLENELNTITSQADRLMGLGEIILPA